MRKIRLVDFTSSNRMAMNRDMHLRMLDAAADNLASLRVGIRATNSGTIVNGRVYKGVHMVDAVDTWFKPYPRPILTHHADGGGMFGPEPTDPKGRVVSAAFTQLRKGKAFENDYKRPDPAGGMGSGFITVEADITDPDAVQKILDGRYLTVSSSQTTNEMTCSICGQDWFEDYCDHSPGHTYQIEVGSGKKKEMREFFCYGIAGPLVYRELSFVNVPAQVNAQVLGILEKDSEDNLNMSTWCNDNAIMNMALCDAEGHIITDLTNERELEMAKEKKTVFIEMPGINDDEVEDNTEVIEEAIVDGEATPEDNVVVDEIETSETPASDLDEISDDNDEDSDVAMSDEDFALAHIAKSIKDNGLWLGKDELSPVFDGETEVARVGDESHSHLVILQKTEDGRVSGRTFSTIGAAVDHDHVIEGDFISGNKAEGETRDASSGENHTHAFEVGQIADEVDDEAVDALIEKLNTAIEDDESETISKEQREMLEAKDFCGPNRSFPVSDASHFATVSLLTARYKSDAATKARVMNTAMRKATKAGVELRPVKVADAADEETPETIELVQGKAVTTVRDEAIEEMMLDHATTKAKLSSLEGSLAEKAQEIQALEDDLVREKARRTEALANTLTIVRTILGKADCKSVGDHARFEAKVVEYAKRTPDSLWDAVSDLLPELDLTIRNLRKINVPVVVPAVDGQKQSKQHIDATNTKASKGRRRGRQNGAEQLSQDLDS